MTAPLESRALAALDSLLEVLRAEAGRLEMDARRFDERGLRQLAADLRRIRDRLVDVSERVKR